MSAIWSRLAPLCGSDLLSDRLLPLLWRLLETGVGPVRTAAAHAAAPMLRSLRYVRDQLLRSCVTNPGQQYDEKCLLMRYVASWCGCMFCVHRRGAACLGYRMMAQEYTMHTA